MAEKEEKSSGPFLDSGELIKGAIGFLLVALTRWLIYPRIVSYLHVKPSDDVVNVIAAGLGLLLFAAVVVWQRWHGRRLHVKGIVNLLIKEGFTEQVLTFDSGT